MSVRSAVMTSGELPQRPQQKVRVPSTAGRWVQHDGDRVRNSAGDSVKVHATSDTVVAKALGVAKGDLEVGRFRRWANLAAGQPLKVVVAGWKQLQSSS